MYGSLREYIDLLEREGELVRIKACVNPVEEMAEISPMCSIMVASAMGRMVKRALMNSGLPSMANRPMASLCRGMPTHAASEMRWKSTAPVTSATA